MSLALKALKKSPWVFHVNTGACNNCDIEVLDALTSLGVENPRDHFAVYNLPSRRRNMVLLSKQPLTEEIRELAFGERRTANG